MESTSEKPVIMGIYGGGKPLFIFDTVSMVILWIMFALRTYVRLVMVKIWSATDWYMLITMFIYTWLCISANVCVWDGFGRDMSTLPGVQLVSAFKAYYFAEMTYVASVLFVKLSLCYFYLPLTNLRWQIYTVYAIVFINSTYTLAYVFVIIFQCSPVDYFWTQFTGTTGRCLSNTVIMNLSYCHNTMEILSDWILSALPIWLLKETQLARRTKIAVALVLSLGAFASIASIVRITKLTSFASSTNYTITSISIILWSIIENGVGIFAANLATLRPLLTSLAQRFGFSSAGGSGVQPNSNLNTRSRHHRSGFGAGKKGRGGGGYMINGGDEEHDLPSLKRENSSTGSYKSTERIVGHGRADGHITTIVSKGPAYDGLNSSNEDLPPMGISKNTEVVVTSERREH